MIVANNKDETLQSCFSDNEPKASTYKSLRRCQGSSMFKLRKCLIKINKMEIKNPLNLNHEGENLQAT